MKRDLGVRMGVSALGGLLLLTAFPAVAAPAGSEKSLLGIRILQSYRDVLKRYGQPTRIYRQGETVGLIPAVDAKGDPTGGIQALADDSASLASTGGGMGGGMGARTGMPAMGAGGSSMMGMMGGRGGMGMRAMPGAAGMGGGMPASMSGMMGGAGGSSMMGMMAGRSGGKGGEDGGGSAARPGGMMGAGMPGLGGGMASGGAETFEQAGGFSWVYFIPKKELVYEFQFNKDGRVEAIIERGRFWGQPTRRGVNLGSSASTVYTAYGWPDGVEVEEDNKLALDYNNKAHAYFSVLNKKVVAIAVFLRESQRIRSTPSGAGRGMAMAGMGGRGAMMGMMGGRGGMGMRSMPGAAGVGGGGGRAGKGGGDGAD